jgi:hypothetical protein
VRSPGGISSPGLTLASVPRLALYCALFLIHMAGLIHGDFAEHNVIRNARGLRVVDFLRAKEHTCKGPGRCSELEDVWRYLGFGEHPSSFVAHLSLFC